jgi:hypothetical protein
VNENLVGGIFNADRLRHAVEFLISAHVDNWMTLKYYDNEHVVLITRFEIGTWAANVHTTPLGNPIHELGVAVRRFIKNIEDGPPARRTLYVGYKDDRAEWIDVYAWTDEQIKAKIQEVLYDSEAKRVHLMNTDFTRKVSPTRTEAMWVLLMNGTWDHHEYL